MLENQVALVTGASRGIGNAIALALGGAGARIIGTSTSADGAKRFGELLASHGYNGRGAVVVAADPASIDALLAQLEEASELPTLLINNAAITRDTLLLRMKPGATAFTVMPREPSSRASALVNPRSPALAAA